MAVRKSAPCAQHTSRDPRYFRVYGRVCFWMTTSHPELTFLVREMPHGAADLILSEAGRSTSCRLTGARRHPLLPLAVRQRIAETQCLRDGRTTLSSPPLFHPYSAGGGHVVLCYPRARLVERRSAGDEATAWGEHCWTRSSADANFRASCNLHSQGSSWLLLHGSIPRPKAGFNRHSEQRKK